MAMMCGRLIFCLALSGLAFASPIFEDGIDELLVERNSEEPLWDVVNEWASPESQNAIGQVGGLSVSPITNELIVFHRGDRSWDESSFDEHNKITYRHPIETPTIAVLDKDSGDIIRHYGKSMFYMPHGCTVDQRGDLWITDVGLHQVIKFKKDRYQGPPTLTLGERKVPGSDNKHFCKPTDVAVTAEGDFFVADGYCNRRIIKFSPEGKLLMIIDDNSFSSVSPQPHYLLVPHSLALKGHTDVCVADRENARILCFDKNSGSYVDLLTFGNVRPYGIAYDNADKVFHVVGLDSHVNSIGATLDTTNNIGYPWDMATINFPHAIAMDTEGREIFVGTTAGNKKIFKMRKSSEPSHEE